jgi:hypothetical protein
MWFVGWTMKRGGEAMSDYSVQALIDFFDYASSKGLLNKSTASAKRIAVERIFEVAEDAERSDVSQVDLTSLMHRFMNLSGSGFKPDSLATYQSRVRSGIDEFLAWKANPMGFKPSKRSSGSKVARSSSKTEGVPDVSGASRIQLASSVVNMNALPIPLRSDLTVVIQGLPFDLTLAEANKVAKVVMAMATEVVE